MAKEFKIRWGYEEDFKNIKLAPREPGLAIDSNKFYMGTEAGNMHIPSEQYTDGMIDAKLASYKIPAKTTTELADEKYTGVLAYNSTIGRVQYKTSSGDILKLAASRDLPLKMPITVQVAQENIEENDNNSVTITGFERPIVMVFLNGVLCTTHASDQHKLTYDEENKAIKIDNCVAGDLITYY
jgi:hypothetical protein